MIKLEDKKFTPLYSKKVNTKSVDKIESISGKLNVPKWLVIDKIISSALGIKTDNPLDLKKWLKTK